MTLNLIIALIFFGIYLLKLFCGKREKWHFRDPKFKNFLWKLDCKAVRIFAYNQVRASSQTNDPPKILFSARTPSKCHTMLLRRGSSEEL